MEVAKQNHIVQSLSADTKEACRRDALYGSTARYDFVAICFEPCRRTVCDILKEVKGHQMTSKTNCTNQNNNRQQGLAVETKIKYSQNAGLSPVSLQQVETTSTCQYAISHKFVSVKFCSRVFKKLVVSFPPDRVNS
jgi:hypothetical protein